MHTSGVYAPANRILNGGILREKVEDDENT